MIKELLFSVLCALSCLLHPMDQLSDQADQYEILVLEQGQLKPKPLRMSNSAKTEPHYLITPTYNNRSMCDEIGCLCVGHTAGCLAECCVLLEWLMGQGEKND